MQIKKDSYSEMLLEQRYIDVQKIFYPITLSFAFLDSSFLSNFKYRVIKLNPFFEKIFKIQMNSPEDNLKVYQFPIYVSVGLLALSIIVSAFLPFIFMTFASKTDYSFEIVTYWIFWASLIFTILHLSGLYLKARAQRHRRRIGSFTDNFKLKKAQLKSIFVESIIVYAFYSIVLYTSNHIENVLICHVQIIAICFSIFFKVGRSITLTKFMMYGVAEVAIGMIITVIYFNNLKSDYSTVRGLLAILAAFLGGAFWLKHMDGTDELNLGLKLTALNWCISLISFILVLFFYSFSGLLAFLLTNFILILTFVGLLFLGFFLKSFVATLFVDLIPSILYIFEPLLLYFYWEIFVRLQQTSKLGQNIFLELLSFFFTKFLVVFVCLIIPQLLVLIEIQRNELNLEGEKIGIKGAERDKMKLEHLKLLKKMSIDK